MASVFAIIFRGALQYVFAKTNPFLHCFFPGKEKNILYYLVLNLKTHEKKFGFVRDVPQHILVQLCVCSSKRYISADFHISVSR